jgi:hypothetical protein
MPRRLSVSSAELRAGGGCEAGDASKRVPRLFVLPLVLTVFVWRRPGRLGRWPSAALSPDSRRCLRGRLGHRFRRGLVGSEADALNEGQRGKDAERREPGVNEEARAEAVGERCPER